MTEASGREAAWGRHRQQYINDSISSSVRAGVSQAEAEQLATDLVDWDTHETEWKDGYDAGRADERERILRALQTKVDELKAKNQLLAAWGIETVIEQLREATT